MVENPSFSRQRDRVLFSSRDTDRCFQIYLVDKVIKREAGTRARAKDTCGIRTTHSAWRFAGGNLLLFLLLVEISR